MNLDRIECSKCGFRPALIDLRGWCVATVILTRILGEDDDSPTVTSDKLCPECSEQARQAVKEAS